MTRPNGHRPTTALHSVAPVRWRSAPWLGVLLIGWWIVGWWLLHHGG